MSETKGQKWTLKGKVIVPAQGIGRQLNVPVLEEKWSSPSLQGDKSAAFTLGGAAVSTA